MASTIITKNGTGSAQPSSLQQGELAINVSNGNLFYGVSGSSNYVSSSFGFSEISASGHISASDLVLDGNLFFNGDQSIQDISGLGDLDIKPGALLRLGPSSTDAIEIGRQSGTGTAGRTEIYAHTATPAVLFQNSTITFNHPITASGNISASGTGSFSDGRFTGNVGIGTTNPQKKLDIAGGDIRLDNSKSILFATTDGNIGRVSITGDESSDFIQLKVDNSNNHILRLNTTGVGIGTSSPGEKLEVVGNISASGDITANKFIGKIDSSDNNTDANHFPMLQSGQDSIASISNGLAFNPGTDTLTIGGTTGIIIGQGNITSSGVMSGSTTVDTQIIRTGTILASGLSNQGSEATAVMINGSNEFGTRELGSNAFTSTTIGTTTNALTVDNATLQLDSGTTFDGSAAKTISIKDGGVDSDALAADIAVTSLTATNITASSNISASGDIVSTGTIRGKQLQVIAANWKDNAGTTEHFIPLVGPPDEQTNGVKEQNAMIMPCSGRVREIVLRMHWTSTITVEDITWRIYNRAKDKKMNGITESHSFTMTNPTQGNSDTNNTRSHILTGTDGQYAAGDAIAISMQWGTTGPTNTADRIYVSVVLENDWNTVSY